jgi:lysophospholipase L1-like esterase
MRITLVLLLAVAVAAATFVAVRRAADDDADSARGAVTLVGDSLNVGVEPYLEDALPGWRVDAHDEVGRATREGIAELRARRTRLAPVVVVSLGTNDAEGTEDEFRALVGGAIRVVGPNRCLVWATIVRDGEERTGWNDVLRDAAAEHPNVQLAEWASLVSDDPTLLAGDRVHGTPDGYARRAEETARAIRAC